MITQIKLIMCSDFHIFFRGALDAKSKEINIEMKIAAVHALKDLAKLPVPDSVLQAYQIDSLSYGSGLHHSKTI